MVSGTGGIKPAASASRNYARAPGARMANVFAEAERDWPVREAASLSAVPTGVMIATSKPF